MIRFIASTINNVIHIQREFQKLNYFIKLQLYISIYLWYLCLFEYGGYGLTKESTYGQRMLKILNPFIHHAFTHYDDGDNDAPNFWKDHGDFSHAIQFVSFYYAFGRLYLLYLGYFPSFLKYILCVNFVPTNYFTFFALWYKGYLFTHWECSFHIVITFGEILINLFWLITGNWYAEYYNEQQRLRTRGQNAIYAIQRMLVPEVQRLEDSIKQMRQLVDFSRLNEDQLHSNHIELQSQLSTIESEIQSRGRRSNSISQLSDPKFIKSDRCIICYDQTPSIYLRPCYHACLCHACALGSIASPSINNNLDIDRDWKQMVDQYEDESDITPEFEGDEDRFYNYNNHLRKELVTCPLCSTVIRGWGHTYVSACNKESLPGFTYPNNTMTEVTKLLKYIADHPTVKKKLKYW
jgi:hypothetical protein